MKVTRLHLIDGSVCSSVKGEESAFVSCGDQAKQRIVAQLGPSANLPYPTAHPLADSYRSPIPDPLPQSTYDEFARARPERVRDGYSRGANIDERIGAHQVLGDRMWFGKAFYDGEGTTGVGGIGYYDIRTKTFTMLSGPELANWSISALLVETNAVWAGLVRYPEGAELSGGLIRYDLPTGNVTRYSIPDITGLPLTAA